ncbi:MAG: hypothetical protein K6F50_04955 [Kiritimatiellae bacterium]|nr:hypothetical protein [Kiritimatiellia bacterium]
MRSAEPYALPAIATAAIACVMTVAWHLSGCHEVMFPEVAAIAMGCLWMERRPWRTDAPRLWLSLVAGALLGYGLVHVPWPTEAKLVLAYAAVLVWLSAWRINAAPMISAALLPLFLGRGATWLYPVSVALWVGLVLLVERAFVSAGLRERVAFGPIVEPFRKEALRISILVAVFAALLLLCRRFAPFAAVPPLVVAYTAFSDVRRPVRLQWRLGFWFFTVAAVLGAFIAAQPDGLQAALMPLAVLIFAWLSRFGAYFLPPAAAALLLAPLAGNTSSYIWQVPMGALVFLSAGRLVSLAWRANDGARR